MSEDDPKPMRVSDWARTPAAGAGPPKPREARQPAGIPTIAPAPAEESPGLPVDPLRLLGGLWQRRTWVVGGLVAGALLGATLGLWRAQTRYAVSVQLMKRDVPDAFRLGEAGEVFKPRQLSGATLVGIATSDNVLRRVAEKAQPVVGLSLLRQSVEAKEQRGTDYVGLTLSGYATAEATVQLANLWAQEVVEFSRTMQSRESHEIRQYLQQQLESTDAELTRINTAMLEYSRAQGLVAPDKQIDAYLRSLGDLDLRYETARLALNATDFKLKSLEAELARQSPLAERLKGARLELEETQTRFTERNPLVLEKQEKVRALEAQLAQEAGQVSADLSRFAGTFLGNTLYLQLLEAQGQRRSFAEQLTELDQLRARERVALAAIPEKEMGLAQLARTKQSLETSRSLIMGRLREAQLFEERAPGYYQIFLPATLDNVSAWSKALKVLVYILAGLLLLGSGATGAALGAELLDGRLRTGAEAARALGAPLFCALPRGPLTPAASADLTARIWIRWLGPQHTGGHLRTIWTPAPSGEEDKFWQLLLAEAGRLRPDLIVVNFSLGMPPPALVALPVVEFAALEKRAEGPRCVLFDPTQLSIERARALVAQLHSYAAAGREVWCRCDGAVREPLSSIARGAAGVLIVVDLGSETIAFWREQAARLRQAVGAPAGIVVVNGEEWNQR